MSLIHASCVAFGDVGVIIRGAPAAGKSSLCLRLIDGEGFGLPRAALVADDQVKLRVVNGVLTAVAPLTLAGKLEIRGLGIITMAERGETDVRLVVDLLPLRDIARLPEASELQVSLNGVHLPRLMLDANSADAPARLRAALGHFGLLPSS